MKTKEFILSAPVDPIRSVMQSDDDEYKIQFDATEWFEQASEDAVRELAECGWSGDYPADDVADYFDRRQNPAMRNAFRHIRGERCGFEVRVNGRDAMAWLRQHRPEQYENILAEFGEPMASESDWERWRQTE